MHPNIELNENDIINIRGITDDKVSSLGTVNLDLIVDNFCIYQNFHTVNDSINLPSDGILGKDFIKGYQCDLNYRDMTCSFVLNGTRVTIPILQGPEQETLVLPARSEVVRKINFNEINEDQVIEQQELEDGVFVARTIINPKNAYIRILNTSHAPKTVKINNLKHDNLSNYLIYNISDVQNTTQRDATIEKLIRKNTPNEMHHDLLPLCSNYSDIFALETDKLTTNNFYKQKIRIRDDIPVYVKNYRLPQAHVSEINSQVEKLLENELIEPTISSYNSPVIIVPKKSTDETKKFRMCIDYRMLNKKLIPDKFPLPRIDEILDQLGRAKYFSVLDLYSGFHQIPIEERDRPITAFSTQKGAFQWKVLPFGLNIAPNSFMRMMHIAFSGLEANQAFLYMDDIIVIGCSKNHHIQNLKSVFNVCRKFNLKLNPLKCQFFKDEVVFLGHRCTREGILPDESKIEAVKRYPTPKSKDEAKRFTAFANYYRRFIKNFAELAAPLNKLTRKTSPFIWTTECEESFQKIKDSMISPPLLQYPDFSSDFTVTVDASKIACGAILSQNLNGHDLPICYISRTFQKGELNKSTIEKELLAIHFAITQLRPYLYGRHFTVFSDHRPLIYLYNLKDPASKLTRIRLEIEEYDFDVVHIKGKDNVGADALSRISITDLKQMQEVKIFPVQTRSMTKKSAKIENESIKSEQEINRPNVIEEINAHFIKKIPRVRTKENMMLYTYQNRKILMRIDISELIYNEKLTLESIISKVEKEALKINITHVQWPLNDYIFDFCTIDQFKKACKVLSKLQISLIHTPITIEDNKMKLKLLNEFHTDPIIGGHCGQKRLYAKLRARYYWPGMIKDIASFVNSCQKCKVNKVKISNKEPMQITETPQKAFEIVITDTVGPLMKSDLGNEYILTIICNLSKYLIAVPIQNKNASTIAKAIFENCILVHGPMKMMKTDKGTEFKNALIEELCKLMHTEHRISTAYHHETVGSVERNHRVLNEYLRSYTSEYMNRWEEYLKYFVFCYNTTQNSAIDMKYSPYELVFGKNINFPTDFLSGTVEPIYDFDNYVKELKFKLQTAHKQAATILNKIKETNKKYFDRKAKPLNINVNDYVLLEREPYNKFKSVYLGPFRVVEVDESNAQIIDEVTNKILKVHKNRLRITQKNGEFKF